MPKLSEEQLAKLYPTAKTYDELQAEREELQERRRPKFVALRVSLYTSLVVVVATMAYTSAAYLIDTFIPTVGSAQSTGAVMIAVFGMCLVGAVAVTTLYYLYNRASALLYLTFVRTLLPTALLGLTVTTLTALVVLLSNYDYTLLGVLTVLTIINFILSYCVVTLSPKQ